MNNPKRSSSNSNYSPSVFVSTRYATKYGRNQLSSVMNTTKKKLLYLSMAESRIKLHYS